eukprot:gene3097-13111_t
MTVLSENIVRGKTRLQNLEEVRNLNLWGQDLSDVSILQKMPNLEILSLSVNQIKSLQDFGTCKQLTELYLRKNEIADASEIRHLSALSNLKTLWLGDNPCAEHPNYRLIVAKALPGLEKLDNTELTPQEKAQAASMPEISSILGVGGSGYAPPAARGPPGSLGYCGAPGSVAPLRQSMQSMSLEGQGSIGVTGSTRKNVMYALMAILPELGNEDLSYVKDEIELRLRSLGR